MDVFIEYLVKKRLSGNDRLRLTLITVAATLLIGGLLVAGILFMQWLVIIFPLECVVIYGWWKVLGLFRVEFEYALTNGELDVDKITAQARRKRLITVDFRKIDILAPVGGEHQRNFESGNFKTKIDASISPDSKGAYFLTIQHPKLGPTRLIFNPDERILEGAKAFASHKVYDK